MFVTLLLLAAASQFAGAQVQKGTAMEYTVSKGDTTFLDELPAARIHPKQVLSKRDWIQYYQRIHNFSKAYPYAIVVSRVMRETDSTFEARGYNKRQRERALGKMKNEVIRDFTPLLRKLTLAQGLMMIRLIDRECGYTPYYIIKHYFNGATAGFWQGVAKIYKGDLKQPYDKYGVDKDLEELVGYWERGEFEALYLWVFDKPAPKVEIPEEYR